MEALVKEKQPVTLECKFAFNVYRVKMEKPTQNISKNKIKNKESDSNVREQEKYAASIPETSETEKSIDNLVTMDQCSAKKASSSCILNRKMKKSSTMNDIERLKNDDENKKTIKRTKSENSIQEIQLLEDDQDESLKDLAQHVNYEKLEFRRYGKVEIIVKSMNPYDDSEKNYYYLNVLQVKNRHYCYAIGIFKDEDIDKEPIYLQLLTHDMNITLTKSEIQKSTIDINWTGMIHTQGFTTSRFTARMIENEGRKFYSCLKTICENQRAKFENISFDSEHFVLLYSTKAYFIHNENIKEKIVVELIQIKEREVTLMVISQLNVKIDLTPNTNFFLEENFKFKIFDSITNSYICLKFKSANHQNQFYESVRRVIVFYYI